MTSVLIGCETSGIVRRAFLDAGFDAWSCDVLPADDHTNRHIQGDVRAVLALDIWDLVCVMHPPCTRLCNSGVRWLHTPPPGRTREEMWAELDDGAKLFSELLNTRHAKHIAIENPVMHRHAKDRIDGYFEFDQSVQPWQFATSDTSGDNVKKRTCFWLRDLPKLIPTGTLDGSTARAEVHNASPGPDRWKKRSRFYEGIASAMADQWGNHALSSTLAA